MTSYVDRMMRCQDEKKMVLSDDERGEKVEEAW